MSAYQTPLPARAGRPRRNADPSSAAGGHDLRHGVAGAVPALTIGAVAASLRRHAADARRRLRQAWLDHARRVINGAGLRGDAWRNVTAIARAIAGRADWSTLLSRPTLAWLQKRTGLSLRTVQRWTRWLENAGLLDVREPGTTPQFRPGVLAPGDANLAREWRLTRPAQAPGTQLYIINGTPPRPPTVAMGNTPPRARTNPPNAGASKTPKRRSGNEDRRCAPDSPPLAPPPRLAQAGDRPSGPKPQRRGEMLAACETLRAEHPALKRLSARRLRSILRTWYKAHWTAADVLYGLERAANDQLHLQGDEIRHPARWLEHRLSYWLDPAGRPMPPHSARLRADADASRARVARDRADRAALGAGRSADYAGHVAVARAALLAKLRAPRDPASGTVTRAASSAPASGNSRRAISLLTVNMESPRVRR